MSRRYTVFTYNEYRDSSEATEISYAISATCFIVRLLSFLGFVMIDDLTVRILCVIAFILSIIVRIFSYKIVFLLTPRKNSEYHAYTEEEMKYAQAYERKAQYFLSLNSLSKEFTEEAQRNNMTKKEFKKWCKDTILKYEEMIREYNGSHTDRWQY